MIDKVLHGRIIALSLMINTVLYKHKSEYLEITNPLPIIVVPACINIPLRYILEGRLYCKNNKTR